MIPGETVTAAWLDLARAVTRRAERLALPVAPPPSLAVVYLNRLSDLLWTMARWQEGQSRTTRSVADPDREVATDPDREVATDAQEPAADLAEGAVAESDKEHP